MSSDTQFLQSIEAFLERHRMKPTPFGRMALNDPNFVRHMRDGRSPTGKVKDRVNAWMKDYLKSNKRR